MVFEVGERVLVKGAAVVVVGERRYGLTDYVIVRYPDELELMVPVNEVQQPI